MLSILLPCRLPRYNPLAARDCMATFRQAQEAHRFAYLSPGCCAMQLVFEASIFEASIELAMRAQVHQMGEYCVRGLMACELALAMDPSCWSEVSVRTRAHADSCRFVTENECIKLMHLMVDSLYRVMLSQLCSAA